MRISGKEADEREAAIRDGSRVGYFGSWEVGEEIITVTKLGTWWRGDELERAGDAHTTIRGDEVDPRLLGY
jgi:hypothetical protein